MDRGVRVVRILLQCPVDGRQGAERGNWVSAIKKGMPRKD